MSKIHTHYDNLKVSRNAPAEVIRAAYKALSQKYHPDKNPGDDKAARIMAILNSAYETLSDPQRRKEHDEWIAAEEWEIAWLESTKEDESDAPPQAIGRAYRPSRDPKWWLVLVICVALGWGGAMLVQWKFHLMPEALSQVWGDGAATPRLPPHVENRVQLQAQISLVGVDQPCNLPPRPDSAPNGELWPNRSGPIEGYRIGNSGGEGRLLLDNSANASDTMVTLFDQDKHLAVRYLFLRAHDKLTLEGMQAASYQVQQQVLGVPMAQFGNCIVATPASAAASAEAASTSGSTSSVTQLTPAASAPFSSAPASSAPSALPTPLPATGADTAR